MSLPTALQIINEQWVAQAEDQTLRNLKSALIRRLSGLQAEIQEASKYLAVVENELTLRLDQTELDPTPYLVQDLGFPLGSRFRSGFPAEFKPRPEYNQDESAYQGSTFL